MNLHSTMVRLKDERARARAWEALLYLHSTMVRLKGRRAGRLARRNRHLHSTMVRLKVRNFTVWKNGGGGFTFHYGQIKRFPPRRQGRRSKYLHSTMVRLKGRFLQRVDF